MKKLFTLFFFCYSFYGMAQDAINYKAIISDGSGNVVANTLVSIQLSILADTGPTNVYTELHTPTTDNNGLIILNISEGVVISGVYEDIDWQGDNHSLNVQVNTGSGLVDLGTMQFMHVPYAHHANTANEASNVSGLEAINEGNGVGWRLVGSDPGLHVGIGENAVDLSFPSGLIGERGAAGLNSVTLGYDSSANGFAATAFGGETIANGNRATAMGSNTFAGGSFSTAMGFRSSASGNGSVAMGNETSASGVTSFSMGELTRADSYLSTVFGRYNFGGGNPTTWIETNTLFEIGNGTSSTDRSNAFTVFKNGNVGIGVEFPQDKLHLLGRFRLGTVETLEDGGINEISVKGTLRSSLDGNHSLGTASSRWDMLWTVNGAVNTSDRRDKTNIEGLEYGLNELMQLHPVRYKWKDKPSEEKKLGLIAQDLLQVIPEVVKTHDWKAISEEDGAEKQRVEMDRMGVYYSDLIPVLIKAIQEQQQTIEFEKEKVKELQLDLGKYKSLEARISALEQENN